MHNSAMINLNVCEWAVINFCFYFFVAILASFARANDDAIITTKRIKDKVKEEREGYWLRILYEKSKNTILEIIL